MGWLLLDYGRHSTEERVDFHISKIWLQMELFAFIKFITTIVIFCAKQLEWWNTFVTDDSLKVYVNKWPKSYSCYWNFVSFILVFKFETAVQFISLSVQQILELMNTYRLEAKNPFKPDCVKHVIRSLIDKELDGVMYDPETCAQLCLTLSAELKSRVKLLGYDRWVCSNNLRFK